VFAQSAERRRAAANLKTYEPKLSLSLDFPSRRAAGNRLGRCKPSHYFGGGRRRRQPLGFSGAFYYVDRESHRKALVTSYEIFVAEEFAPSGWIFPLSAFISVSTAAICALTRASIGKGLGVSIV
jgi:hypothetical protein